MKLETIFGAYVLIMIIGYIIYKARPLLKVIKGAIKDEIFLDKKSALAPEQYRQLALGAIYSQQQAANANTLKTGRGKMWARGQVIEWWSLYSNKDTRQKLRDILDYGLRSYDPIIPMVLNSANANSIQTTIQQAIADKDEQQYVLQLAGNLNGCLEELRRDQIISNNNATNPQTTAGFDCGRVVFLARMCYDAGFLSEAEAWAYISEANTLALSIFDSWESFSNSYVLGRAMWGGEDSVNSGIAAHAKTLLTKEESPWKQLAWK